MNEYVGLPRQEVVVAPGDALVLYGRADTLVRVDRAFHEG